MRVAATRLAACPAPRLILLLGSASVAIRAAAMAGHVVGGAKENLAAANSAEADGLARFAVDEHNKRQVSVPPARASPTPNPAGFDRVVPDSSLGGAARF
jgi:hypothetical protein